MRALTSFDERDSVPWANGAGTTTVLVSLTESESLTPGLLRWRLSIAALERPSPFSRLPGMLRTFLPTAEAALSIDARVHRASPRAPLRFHGDQDVSLIELVDRCFAVNLMVEDCGAGPSEHDSRLAALQMHRPSRPEESADLGRRRFVLTLEPTADLPRFQLLELTESDALPKGLELVVLG